MSRTIVILDGDQTGQELLEEALTCSRIQASFAWTSTFYGFDLSLENRRATKNQVVYEAGKAMREHHLALKAATITPDQKGDVGSPNRILREEMDAEVILRTGRRIPGVRPIAGVYAPYQRGAHGPWTMLTEPKSGAKGKTARMDEVAYRTEKVSRLCLSRRGRVCVPSCPKYWRQGIWRP